MRFSPVNRLLSPIIVLAITLAMLLLPRVPLMEKAGLSAPLPFGAEPAWADSIDPSNGGGKEPGQEPDVPHP